MRKEEGALSASPRFSPRHAAALAALPAGGLSPSRNAQEHRRSLVHEAPKCNQLSWGSRLVLNERSKLCSKARNSPGSFRLFMLLASPCFEPKPRTRAGRGRASRALARRHPRENRSSRAGCAPACAVRRPPAFPGTLWLGQTLLA